MKRQRTPDEWRRAVFRGSKLAPPACRLYLLYLAEYMSQKRIVSRGRHLIASDLGVSERAVDKYTAQAHEAGFLSTIVKGHNGTTAVYQGTFPESCKGEHCVRPTSPELGERNVRATSDQNVRPTSTSSANTGFAPSSNAGTPDECPTCAGWGCERCAG